MNKILILISLLVLISMTGCGESKGNSDENDEAQNPGTTTDTISDDVDDEDESTEPELTEPEPKPIADTTAPTSCEITSPQSKVDIRNIITLTATGSDDVGIASVKFYSDPTTLIAETNTQNGSQWTATWDSTSVNDSRQNFYAVCYDAAGNASAPSPMVETWVSNLRGSMMGINQRTMPWQSGSLLTREVVDVVADELHLRWIRIDFNWAHQTEQQFLNDMANRDNGRWTSDRWNDLRDVIEYAKSKNVRIIAIAASAYPWVRGENRTDGGNEWKQAILPDRRDEFAEYAKQLCLAGADAVEVTNEPNFKTQYSFGANHPRKEFPDERVDDYVLLLQTIYNTIKADPKSENCLVGIGGAAGIGHRLMPNTTVKGIHPTEWYNRLFNATADDRVTPISAAGYFDFVADHPYANFNSGTGPLQWDVKWGNNSSLAYGDSVNWHGIARIKGVRNILEDVGEGDKKIWATELGSPTFGGACLDKPCMSEAEQADWIDDYAKAWMEKGSSGFQSPLATNYYGGFTGPMILYQLYDKSNGTIGPTDKEGFFGLIRYDESLKPSFARVQMQALLPRP